jgi:hypothetical protein
MAMSLNDNRRPHQAAEATTETYSHPKRSWPASRLMSVLWIQNTVFLLVLLVMTAVK